MLRSLFPIFFSLLFVCTTFTNLEAQYQRSKRKQAKHRFNAGLIIGGNLSQVDGDRFTGFDKLGFRGGLKGAMYLHDRLDIVVGLLYNQKGSRFEGLRDHPSERGKTRAIELDYMEVPFLISYKLRDTKKGSYVIETGFSYARMVDFRIKERVFDLEREVSFAVLADDFNRNELNYIAGISYFFDQHIGIGFHYTVQLNKVYDNPLSRDYSLSGIIRNDPATQISLLRNYQMAVQLVYNIF